ncbi:MAG TPA: serine/threonine-protein kinase [Kofleriaceae bacterium]|nr:serine/threonine-protein kinase [Kofleriaceae bacterium]
MPTLPEDFAIAEPPPIVIPPRQGPEGEVLDDTYRVGPVIGRGGMSAVHEATHLRLGHRVAIKFLDRNYRNYEEAYARFRREAEIASSLGHDNIAKVTDFNTLPDGMSYMVMERLEGMDLGRRLAQGPLTVEQVIEMSAQLSSALAAAHRSCVIHRDLKPDNIFLCPNDSGGYTVKVLDFGISKIRGAMKTLTNDAQLMGTPAYMSPEQARGERALIDERSDIYSLGAVLYEALSGKPAYDGDNVYEILTRIATTQPPPLPGFAAQVDAVLQKAMARDPARRFATVADLHRALVFALTGKRIRLSSSPGEGWQTVVSTVTEVDPLADLFEAEPVFQPVVEPAPVRRPRWPWLAVAGAVVIGAVAVVVLWPAAGADVPRVAAPVPTPTPTPTVIPTAPPPAPVVAETVTVTLQAVPSSARLELDGKPVHGAIELPRSTTPRVLAASAPGYRARTLEVVADRDHTVQVRLEAVKRAKPPVQRAKPGLVRGSEL